MVSANNGNQINIERKKILLKVKEILCEVLCLDDINDLAEQEDYNEWDSMAYLSILSNFEEEFDICITQKNINSFNSVENIIQEILNGREDVI